MLIKVKVFPQAKKEGIIKRSDDSFEVRVKEKPIKGQANKAVVKLLSFYFKISEEKIRLIKGFRGKNKIFELVDEDKMR
jgi:uncharacterized protein (TIGR00251 family)